MPKVNFDETTLYRKIGEKIRIQREDQEFSQSQLADSADLTRASLSNIELGKQKVPIHKLYLICNFLNCRISDVLPSDDEISVLIFGSSAINVMPSAELSQALSEYVKRS